MVDRIFVYCLCNEGARLKLKYLNVEMSIRMRPLNSLALNDPSRFQSKNPGYRNPLSWAHRCQGHLTRIRLNLAPQPPYNTIVANAIQKSHLHPLTNFLSCKTITSERQKNHEPLDLDVHLDKVCGFADKLLPSNRSRDKWVVDVRVCRGHLVGLLKSVGYQMW